MISGCKDNQTSADYYNRNTRKYAGALTTSFLESIKKSNYNNITFYKLINDMRIYLSKNNFTQTPQISSNKKINNNSYYIKNNTLLVQYILHHLNHLQNLNLNYKTKKKIKIQK